MNFKNKKTNFLSILGLIVFITIFLFALVALFRFNNSKSMVIKGNENVITFDIMSENDRKDIFNIYWEIEEVFTNDDDANKINIIVNNNNPLYLYVENGTIKQGDVIYVPKIKDTPFEISLEYIEEDTSEETIEYINSRYDGKCKSLVMKYANLSDIIADDVNIESHEFDKENPVNFHWTQIGSKSFENEKIALNGIVTPVNAASLEGYISNKENKQFTDKGEFIYNSYFNKIGFEVDMGKELDIIFSLNDAIIDDFDGKEATENDRLILDGELKLLNIKPDFNFEWDFDSDEPLKNLKAKVSYELETSLKSTFGGEQIDLYEALTSSREVNEDKFDNKIFGKIGGIDFDKKIVLGAVGLNIGLGKTTIGLKNMQNEQILTPFQPIIILMLTIDVDGTISAELVTELQYKTIVESGYCIAKNNDDGIKLCDYNEKIDSKHSYLFKKYKYESKENDGTGLSAKFEAGGKVNADAGLNASVGAMILGIIPASANAGIDIGMNGSLYGVVDTESIDESGIKANASFYVKFIADAETKIVWNKNDKTEIGLDLNIPIYEKYLFKREIANYNEIPRMINFNNLVFYDTGEVYEGKDIEFDGRITSYVSEKTIPRVSGQSNFGEARYKGPINNNLGCYDEKNKENFWLNRYCLFGERKLYVEIDDKIYIFKTQRKFLNIHDIAYIKDKKNVIESSDLIRFEKGLVDESDVDYVNYPIEGTNCVLSNNDDYGFPKYINAGYFWIECKDTIVGHYSEHSLDEIDFGGDPNKSHFKDMHRYKNIPSDNFIKSANALKNLNDYDIEEYIKIMKQNIEKIEYYRYIPPGEIKTLNFENSKIRPLYTILKNNVRDKNNSLITVFKGIQKNYLEDKEYDIYIVVENENVSNNEKLNDYDYFSITSETDSKYKDIETFISLNNNKDYFEEENNNADGKVGSYIIHNEN